MYGFDVMATDAVETARVVETITRLKLPLWDIEVHHRAPHLSGAIESVGEGKNYARCFQAVKGKPGLYPVLAALLELADVVRVDLTVKSEDETISVRRQG